MSDNAILVLRLILAFATIILTGIVSYIVSEEVERYYRNRRKRSRYIELCHRALGKIEHRMRLIESKGLMTDRRD